MATSAEALEWANRFGVAVEQIRRDHLVSHILAAIPQIATQHQVVFIGGTALARSHLDGLRVSEDIDLLVNAPRDLSQHITNALPRIARRAYPQLRIGEPFNAPRGVRLHAVATNVATVEIQLIRREPTDDALEVEPQAVSLRYSDLPASVDLTLPTMEAFAAMKLAAYRDRAEPRDLFDLAHLARRGAITTSSLRILRTTTGSTARADEFTTLPRHTNETWSERLAHQTRHLMTAEEALQLVHGAVAAVADKSLG